MRIIFLEWLGGFMRPTRQETDLEYWSNAVAHWTTVEEQYFLMDDREGESRASAHKFRAELALQEAQGLIVVYSGRPKPAWAT